ncbi:IS1 family transposase [Citrobacter portucalensis]|uniref:IS1 family transposase n=1 Tax=Citrobacter portucalensis TaxID=1639133 RepID=UPI003979775A
MWYFVGNKRQQRWLWYAWEPSLKRIIAHAFGRRSKKNASPVTGAVVRFSCGLLVYRQFQCL